MGRGKERDGIWKHWKSTNDGKVKCRYCGGFPQQPHATRLKSHTAICVLAPTAVNEHYGNDRINLKLLKARKSQLGDEEKKALQLKMDAIDAECSAPAVCSSVASISNRINKIPPKKFNNLKEDWCKAMISGNVSFNFTDNFYLKSFFENLQSGFTPPSRREISSSILTKLNDESMKSLCDVIGRERFLSVIPDGWQNIKGLGVINVILANSNQQIFYKSFETGNQAFLQLDLIYFNPLQSTRTILSIISYLMVLGGDTQTGQFIKEKLLEIIEDIISRFGNKIVAIVSDQGSNYLMARNQIAASRAILSVSCSAHLFILLVGDIAKLPCLQKLLNKAKAIVKEIKASKVKQGEYYREFDRWIEEQKSKGNNPGIKINLTLPAVTRWFGIRDMLRKIRRAKPVLLRLAIREDFSLTVTNTSTIKDDVFWSRLDAVFPLFEALTDAIAKVEGNSACLSDVVEEMIKLRKIFTSTGSRYSILKNALNSVECKKAESIFSARMGEQKVTTLHYLANLLDPRYRGKGFIENEDILIRTLDLLQTIAYDFEVVRNEEDKEMLGSQLTNYRMKEGLFSSQLLTHSVPNKYWENLIPYQSTVKIATLGCIITSIPASSASVERSFSVQGHVHSKSRNRLSSKNVDNMTRIKWMLDQKSKHAQELTKKPNDMEDSDEALQMQLITQEEYQQNIDTAEDEDENVDIDEIVFFDNPFTEDELQE